MLRLEFKLFLKNLWFLFYAIILVISLFSVSIYFLFLQITEQLSEGLKDVSLLLLLFPNYLIYLSFLYYWNMRSNNFLFNNEYYLLNITSKNSMKNNLKYSLYYFLLLLPFSLFFVIVELIISASIQNFLYIFVYYFVFYWLIIFFLLKITKFINIKSHKLKIRQNYFFSFIATFLLIICIGSFLVIANKDNFINRNGLTFVLSFFIFIFNPNLFSIYFLIGFFNSETITAIILVCIILLLILFIVFLKDWLSDKKLLRINNVLNLLISINSNKINYFLDNTIFTKVNFSIYQGERISLLGRNGSGKTTLIKVLTKSLLSKKTKLFWKQDPFIITGVFQEFQFYDGFKCFEIIKYYSYLYDNKFTNDQINHIFKEFELEEYKDKFYKDLSYGTKQKIKIIFALINKPDLLIMDEPFLGVDLVWKKLCMAKIKELFLNKPETALIFISHVLQDHKELTNKYFLVADKTVKKIKSIDEYINSSKALYKKFKL